MASRIASFLLVLGFLASPAAPAVEEVPFVTTPDNVTLAMLRLAKVGPSDFVVDLGSGDGRIVIVAAKQFGARGLGVEIVPDLVRQSQRNARRAGVAHRVEFREQDLFKTDLSKATVVTMYLLPDVNLELRPALLRLKPGTRIVSHDWDMGDWKPDQTVRVRAPDKKVGREKTSRVHLWIVPARVQGFWCGTGELHGSGLDFEQRHQSFRAAYVKGDVRHAFDGAIDGPALRAGRGAPDLRMEWEEDRLRVTQARGEFAFLAGAMFAPRPSAACP